MTQMLVILCALGAASLPVVPIAAQAPSDQPATAAVLVAAPPATPAAADPRADRTFHPDYSRALTPDQMSVAWQAEIDRLFQPVMAGGG